MRTSGRPSSGPEPAVETARSESNCSTAEAEPADRAFLDGDTTSCSRAKQGNEVGVEGLGEAASATVVRGP